MIKAFSLIISIYLVLPCQALAQAEEQTVVALFGDSISVGLTDTFRVRSGGGRANYGWPSIYLTSLLNDSLRPSVVLNWGESGSPSGPTPLFGLDAFTNGLERITNSLIATRNAYPSNAYFVLIMYGTNDPNWGISESTTGFNTRLMIQRARAQGFVPVVATLTPRIDRVVTAYNSNIAAAASAEGAVLIDHFSIFLAAGGGALLGDDVHPNEAGYQVIAQTWFDRYLQAVIEPEKTAVIAPIIQLLLDD